MRNLVPRLMICGEARSGKDTFADMICESSNGGYSKRSSSECAIENAIFPRLDEIYSYREARKVRRIYENLGADEAYKYLYENRFGFRACWKEAICEYNSEDPCRLMKELFRTSNIYVGIRSLREFTAGEKAGVFDLSVWVERPGVDEDESNEITSNNCQILVRNDGRLSDLRDNALAILDFINPLLLRPSFRVFK
jgi:hypothetical protein